MFSSDDDPYSPLVIWGRELRHYRLHAGMTQEQLATTIRYSESLISQLENGRCVPQVELVQACDKHLKTGGALTRLLDMLSWQRHPTWFREYVRLERRATVLRIYSLGSVTGLLQTESYARKQLRAGMLWASDEEVEALVAARMERQDVLTRQDGPRLFALIDESVLHRDVGGSEVMAEQLQHLLEMAEHPRITIQIVPLCIHPGVSGSFSLAEMPDGRTVGWLDHLEGALIDRPTLITMLNASFDAISAEAHRASASLDIIREALKRWT